MDKISKRLENLNPEKRALLLKKLREQRKKTSGNGSIPPRQNRDEFPLAFEQKRLWFLGQLEPNSSFYNIPVRVDIAGPVSLPVLKQAFQWIASRHEVLRARFETRNGQPVQIVEKSLELNLKEYDLTDNPPEIQEDHINRIAYEEATKPFQLNQAPLWRIAFIHKTPEAFTLILTFHHIIADGWSLGVLLRELAKSYSALVKGEQPQLPPLPIQYSDYAAWQEQQLKSDAFNKQLEYWRHALADVPPALNLPLDKPRPRTPSYQGNHLRFVIPGNLVTHLKTLGQKNQATLFMVLLAAYHVLLHRLSAQDDICVGVPVANREKPELQPLIGFLINTVVIRGNLSNPPNFEQFLRQIRQTTLEAFAHQDVPFEKVVEAVQPDRSGSQSPLIQTLFVMQNTPREAIQAPDMTLSYKEVETGTVKFDLTLSLEEDAEGNVVGFMGYKTDLFEETTVHRFIEYYRNLLQQVVLHPEKPVSMLPLIGQNRVTQIVRKINSTPRNPVPLKSLHVLFEEQALRTPDKVAVEFPSLVDGKPAPKTITYQRLNEQANQLAHWLINQGIGLEDVVAVSLPRSPEQIIALLGILKAGGAYLPIDPQYPEDRMQFLLEDSGAKVLVTTSHIFKRFSKVRVNTLLLDENKEEWQTLPKNNPSRSVSENSLAYIIYTSGSTGIPKGVMVEHRSVVNYVHHAVQQFELTATDRVLQFASISFDAAAEEIYPTLVSGGTLVLRTDAMIANPEIFLRNVGELNITVLDLPTAYWHQVVTALEDGAVALPSGLRLVIIGGERAMPEKVQQWWKRVGNQVRLLNTYGPTESTIVATTWELSESSVHYLTFHEVPIGKPVTNVSAYVVDAGLNPVPEGIPGELVLGGAGIARGYLNRPELTAEKFIPNPFSDQPGDRLYCTGDLVRVLPDGNLEYLGRLDQQVKVKGYRIELGEIEKRLRAHPRVKNVVVWVPPTNNDEKRLIAWYIPENPEAAPLPDELRQFLQAQLPDYMIPAAFIKISEIPLTPQGKVNYKKLPLPETGAGHSRVEYVAPRTPLEKALVQLWQEVLPDTRIGVKDNFFELGGDSLKAAMLINQLQEKLGEVVWVAVLFDHQTIESLARYLEETYAEGVLQLIPPSEQAAERERLQRQRTAVAAIDAEKIAGMREHIQRHSHLYKAVEIIKREVSSKNPPAIFILSAPRSGSTLLRVMLAGNPALFSPPELALLQFETLSDRKQVFLGRESGWSEGLLRAIMQIHQCDFETAKQILEKYEREDWPVWRFYGQLQKWLRNQFLVDKTTTYALNSAVLERAELYFENPKYIHLIRHPAAMIQSYLDSKLDQVFGTGYPFTPREKAELFWIIANQNIREFLRSIPEERHFFLHYEDLVRNPQSVTQQLCEFLNVPFDSEMLNPYANPHQKMTDGVHPESRMVGDPKFHRHKQIDAFLAEKWHTLPEGDILSDEAVQLAEALGYRIDSRDRAFVPVKMPPLKPVSREGALPLSFAQERLWFLDQLNPGNPQYNIPGAVRIRGPLDLDVLKVALKEIVRRHEVLRSTFHTVDGRSQVRIHPDMELDFRIEEILSEAHKSHQQIIQEKLKTEAKRGFNLAEGPLFRILVLKIAPDDHVLMVTFHHIVSDGWSVGVFLKEMAALYRKYKAGENLPLPPLEIQYVDYAAWQREWLASGVMEQQMVFWKEQLTDMPQVLELPTDFPRPATISGNGNRLAFELEPTVYARVKALAQAHQVTPYAILLTAFAAFLYRLSGQEDFGIGTPVAGRTRKELEPLIGFFVNTLVIRSRIQGTMSYLETVRQFQRTISRSLAHQELPFEKLVSELAPERSMSHAPLFQVMFAYQQSQLSRLDSGLLSMEPILADSGTAKFDLTLEVLDQGDKFAAIWEYSTDLFQESTIKRWTTYFTRFLTEVLRHPEQPVGWINLLPEEEKHQILVAWNQTTEPIPEPACAHRVFEQVVDQYPEAIALDHKGHQLTYAELNQRANQLAHYLRELGVGPEVPVAISLDRSLEMIVGILGILKAGGAYVPVDPAYPRERIQYILEETQSPILVTVSSLNEIFQTFQGTVVNLDTNSRLQEQPTTNPANLSTPDNLAYFIFTSGSTGKPKGVMLQHKGLVNMGRSYLQKIGLKPGKRVLQFFSVSFDGSVADIFMALFSGSTLYIVPREIILGGEALVQFLENNGITHMVLTPSLLTHLPKRELPELEVIVCGGENYSPELVLNWQKDTRQFFNVYGPTEATVATSVVPVDDIVKQFNKVLIGPPLPNYRHYVVDEYLNPVPIGAIGELLIGGVGVARGYLNRPDLTAERFIPDPFSGLEGEQLYRTGDLVRLLPNGYLEFVGRKDFQVKVRGFRIELGEIEVQLESHPAVKKAAVIAHEGSDGQKRLVAFVQIEKSDETPEAEELKNFLSKSLPDYMIPSVIVFLDSLPLSPSGKVDRKALPEPNIDRATLRTEYIAPRDETEKILVEIWEELLPVERVGVRDNFFELGGDSILSIQVIARANQRGIKLLPRHIFEAPTIEELAQRAGEGNVIEAEQGVVSGEVQLTPIQKWFFEQQFANPHYWHQSLLLEVKQPLDEKAFIATVHAIAQHHDALRLRFRNTPNGWIAEIPEEIHPNIASINKLSASNGESFQKRLEAAITTIQHRVNIETGPLFHVGYLDGGSEGRFLFFTVHHLAVDGLSWRILLDDFQRAYHQATAGKTIQFLPKTTSVQYWANRLYHYSQEPHLQTELEFWKEMLSGTLRIPADNPEGSNTEGDVETLWFDLDANTSHRILKDVPAAFQLQPQELLLAALAQAIHHWKGFSDIVVAQESHGRPDLFDDVDITRTVGWFTAMYPVRIAIPPLESPGEFLKQVKETVRGIPNMGIGFGLLKYVVRHPDVAEAPLPAISFNYLGQFEQDAASRGVFAIRSDVPIIERDLQNHRPFELGITASVRNGKITVAVSFSRKRWQKESIDQFLRLYKERLHALMEFCLTTDEVGYIAADFTDVDLDDESIEGILDELGEDFDE